MSKCLLLSDGEGRLLALRQTLEVHGFTAVPDPADAELFCAREAGHGLFVLGAGEGCLRALFLAERYPVDGLALIGCPLRPRAASALRRRVERELFSVVCDVLAVQPLADAAMLPRAADIVLRGVSSRRRLRLDLGQDHVDLWTNCRQALEVAILRFLQPQSYAKTLARLGDSW